MKKKLNINRTARYNIMLLVLLGALMIFFSIQNDRFITLYNLMNIVRQNVPQVLIGCGLCFVVTAGGIDLSTGSCMALSAIIYGKLCLAGLNAWVAVVLCLVFGVLLALVNTVLSENLRIPSIMGTLATQLICGGLALTIVKAIPISDQAVKPVTVLNQLKFFDKKVPLAFFVVLAVILLFIFLEKKTLIGKYALAIGGNANAAFFSGINVWKMRFVFFALCSVLAAFSGIWQVARLGSADPKIGDGMHFTVLSACILGGVNIKGGEGTVIGCVLGTYILAVLTNGMQMMDISSFYQQVVIGIVMLAALLINQLTANYSAKKVAMAKEKATAAA